MRKDYVNQVCMYMHSWFHEIQ